MLTSDIDPGLFEEELEDKTVIITGGASGIGAETVRLFHDHGANVVVADLSSTREAALTLLTTLRKEKSNAMFIEADIQDWENMKRVYHATIERFGSVDIVVANAGTMERLPFFDMDHLDEEPTSAYKVIDVNLKGTMNTLRLGIHHMRSNSPTFSDGSRGSVVLISSMSGYFGGTGVVSYVATKHAITGLLRSSQATASTTNIRVNAVAPFFTPTQITVGFSQQWREKNLQANTTSDVARTVLYTAITPDLRGRCMMVAGKQVREVEGPREEFVPAWLGDDIFEMITEGGKLFKELGTYPLPPSGA